MILDDSAQIRATLTDKAISSRGMTRPFPEDKISSTKPHRIVKYIHYNTSALPSSWAITRYMGNRDLSWTQPVGTHRKLCSVTNSSEIDLNIISCVSHELGIFLFCCEAAIAALGRCVDGTTEALVTWWRDLAQV